MQGQNGDGRHGQGCKICEKDNIKIYNYHSGKINFVKAESISKD